VLACLLGDVLRLVDERLGALLHLAGDLLLLVARGDEGGDQRTDAEGDQAHRQRVALRLVHGALGGVPHLLAQVLCAVPQLVAGMADHARVAVVDAEDAVLRIADRRLHALGLPADGAAGRDLLGQCVDVAADLGAGALDAGADLFGCLAHRSSSLVCSASGMCLTESTVSGMGSTVASALRPAKYSTAAMIAHRRATT